MLITYMYVCFFGLLRRLVIEGADESGAKYRERMIFDDIAGMTGRDRKVSHICRHAIMRAISFSANHLQGSKKQWQHDSPVLQPDSF